MVTKIDEEEQSCVDVLANEIQNGIDHPFNLYLRPFWSDAALRELSMNKDNPMDPDSIYNKCGETHLATVLTRLSAKIECVLIKLGKPPATPIGRSGANLNNDANWFAEFMTLARRAKRIFVVVGSSAGTLQEISWLKDHDLLQKVLVLMPPDRLIPEAEKHWDGMQEEFAKLQLQIPLDREFFGVFRWNSNGAIELIRQVPFWSNFWLANAIGIVSRDFRLFESRWWLTILVGVPLCFVGVLVWWGHGVWYTMRNWWIRTGRTPLIIRLLMLPLSLLTVIVIVTAQCTPRIFMRTARLSGESRRDR